MTQNLIRRRDGGMGFLDGGSGLAVVLLHGIPGSARTWAPVGERLAARYRVLIPDLLGFGQSARPAGDYYMEAQARGVGELLNRLGVEEVVLAGHDFGGPVALTLHRLFPGIRIRGIVLSATNLFTDTYVPPPLRVARIPGLGSLCFWLMAGTRLGIRVLHAAAVARKQDVPWRDFRHHLTDSGVALTWRIFRRSLADLPANYGAIERQLGALMPPVLILWGDRDPFFSCAVAERSRDAIPGAVLRVFHGTGHFVPEERPVEVAAEIGAFLAGTVGGTIGPALAARC